MKILWLSHLVPYPPKSGVLQRSYNLVKEISKHHEVFLLSFIQKDQLNGMFSSVESGLEEAKTHLKEFCNHVEFIKIPCERSKFGKSLLALKSFFTHDPYTINWLKAEEMLHVINKIKDITNFDLIHFDTISLAPYITEFPGLAKVLDHHNIESHMMLRRAQKENNLLKKLYFKQEGNKLIRYEKLICTHFDLHITCSTLDSRRLSEIDQSLNIREIPNGVDVDYFIPQPQKEIKKHLIFAGGLNWYPNADAMIFFAKEIWPFLKLELPDAVMNIVGKSPPSELIKLASEDNNFRVHGFVDDVREYISKASIYICPIRDGGGTKLKLLDAFAMGIPTVAHPIACEGLDVIDGLNILLAKTPEDFVNKILLLVENSELRKSIASNARNNAVTNYSFVEIGNDLSKSYIEVLDNFNNIN